MPETRKAEAMQPTHEAIERAARINGEARQKFLDTIFRHETQRCIDAGITDKNAIEEHQLVAGLYALGIWKRGDDRFSSVATTE